MNKKVVIVFFMLGLSSYSCVGTKCAALRYTAMSSD